MAEDNDDSQKTEEPTQRKLDEALKKGQIAFSREVTSFLMLFTFALMVTWMAPMLLKKSAHMLSFYLEHAGDIAVDSDSIRLVAKAITVHIGYILAIPIIAAVIAAIAASIVQNGFIASIDPIIPKFDRISPLAGLKRLFSMKSLVEFFKGLCKISLIGWISYIAVAPALIRMSELHTYDMSQMLMLLAELTRRVLIGACIFMAFIAGVDYFYQRYDYIKNMRMSKHDLKEEFKQSEGNPEVKAKLRQIRMERARQRMMAAVPNADVIITNPTHFSLALKYDSATMRAPMCIAKGQDNLALKIREIAKEHDIPIIENPPLARALYQTVEVDQVIPVEHYQAVAEIIGYVYRLKGKMPVS